ncbi:MAG: hypothetical protein ACLRPU_13540, partial [Enterococcus hulanensis]
MAENKKKRKWLSTNALKEFINDITEEELKAEELYNESRGLQDNFDLEEESFNSELEEPVNPRQSNPELAHETDTQLKEESSEQPVDIQRIQAEFAALKTEAEGRVQEVETENERLKEKLNME